MLKPWHIVLTPKWTKTKLLAMITPISQHSNTLLLLNSNLVTNSQIWSIYLNFKTNINYEIKVKLVPWSVSMITDGNYGNEGTVATCARADAAAINAWDELMTIFVFFFVLVIFSTWKLYVCNLIISVSTLQTYKGTTRPYQFDGINQWRHRTCLPRALEFESHVAALCLLYC